MNDRNMKDYVLTTCRECGNTGLLKKVGQYDQCIPDYCDGEIISTYDYNWVMLECPVCKAISLYQRFTCDYMIDSNGNEIYEENVVYPSIRIFKNVPKDILKSYEAAVKSAKVDYSISLIAIRTVLEKICKERGTNRKNLDAMLKQMVEKHILPDTLDKCGFIIRKMGNSGAHGDDDSMLSGRDIAELIDFIETIMYYIYELPVKVDALNQKYKLKLEERDQQEKQEATI